MVVIVVLAIRERIRKRKYPKKYKTKYIDENLYAEKDVLMMDKKIITPSDEGYRSANKAKFSYIIFIVLFLIGLAIVILFNPLKERPVKSTVGSDNSVFEQKDTSPFKN